MKQDFERAFQFPARVISILRRACGVWQGWIGLWALLVGIHRWAWRICQGNDCLNPLVQVKLPSLMSSVVKSQKLVNLGNPCLSTIWIQELLKHSFFDGTRNCSCLFSLHFSCITKILHLIGTKKCPICWVSHLFSIWKHRYSYGICFGSVCALQNFTPNIFLLTPVGPKFAIF